MKSLAGLAGALMFVVPTASFAATYVVAIGNNYGKKQEPVLRYAERDAQQFSGVMAQLGRISPENEMLVLGKDNETVRGLLLKTNARIRGLQGEQGSLDVLIVYYSGHADATGLHLGQSVLGFEELKTIVESSPARVRVLVIDSCRSGGVTQVKGAQPAEPFSIRLDDRLEAEGMAIIASSASSEDSQESDSLGASFFTHHLVNALRGAGDNDRNGRVTLNEAYSYAYRETLRSSGRTMTLQHPTYAYDIRGKGDVPLTFLADGSDRSGTLSIGEPGVYLVFEREESGTLAAEISVARAGTELLLPPGQYFVQRRSETKYRQYRLELEPSQTVSLGNVKYEELTYSRLLRKGGGSRASIHNLRLMGALHGNVLDGQGVAPGLIAGYSADFAWLSVGGSLRWGRSSGDSVDGLLSTIQDQLGLRIAAERFVDLSWVSLSLGLFAEGIFIHQSFETQGESPSRSSLGMGFGGFVAAERELSDRLYLRLETGPMTQLFRQAQTTAGAEVGDEIASAFTWWLAIGGGWRL